jgi:cell division protein FtsB
MMTWNTRTNCVRKLLELLVLNMVVYIKYNKRYALKG